ncbi:ThiJ/PfpI [Coprinopsis marcescibilis]|uniref:ThiJ/PfpI n=1 Tax=Coprinopsis marcescibilis TaxID=230819 RepID=A0A5C3L1L6_COPMA|nr:ThiJ/PfpI [Coprinopsis marcescibilis]
MSSAQSSPLKLTIGVLIFPDSTQWLDFAGPVDYLHSHSREYFELLKWGAPHIVEKAPSIQWHFLSASGTLDPVHATAGPLQTPTTTFATCPPLDYLLVPGPDPAIQLSEEGTKFIQDRFPTLKGLFTVCTGSVIIAKTGVLDGLQVTTNKMVAAYMTEFLTMSKNVKWVVDRRFVVDGKVWSGAGVTAGIDLMAEFVRVNFDPELAQVVQSMTEYKPNPAQPDPFAHITKDLKFD